MSYSRFKTGAVYNFYLIKGERKFKTQISIVCGTKRISLAQNVDMGKFYIEKRNQILDFCESFNESSESFELNCYEDRSVDFINNPVIETYGTNYEKELLKELAELGNLVNDRAFDVCDSFTE